MTVGISFDPGDRREAIVVTDSRVSISGSTSRQSDSVTKVGVYHCDDFHGVIFGTGGASNLDGLIAAVQAVQHSESDLDSFVKALFLIHKERGDSENQTYLEAGRSEILKRARVFLPEAQILQIEQRVAHILDEKERAETYTRLFQRAESEYNTFISNGFNSLIQSHDSFSNQNPTHFVLVAFDKDSAHIRQFNIYDKHAYQERFTDHLEIGSGSDGANMYFSENLQGIPFPIKGTDEKGARLTTPDLVFFAVNAFNNSTINAGVGGTPKILRINETGTSPYPIPVTKALVNLSGAYLSRFAEQDLTHQGTRELMARLLNGEPEIYGRIGQILDMTPSCLRTAVLPYNQWQERANLRLFGEQE